MWSKFKTALTSILLLIALCVGANAAVPENRALGDFAGTQYYVDENPEANQLASLESFGFFQKRASECCNATNRVPDGIWDRGQFTPIQRGNLIEDHLAGTDYSGWTRVGSQNNGFSPAWDFNQGSTWVSLKTVDTAGTGWQSSMRSHINELSQWSSPTTPNSTRVLDIRVQPGGGASAQSLIDYGATRGVVVRINEF